jgi:nicotinamidase-related amidase
LAYDNQLRLLKNAPPLLADHPDWVEPIRETNRFEAAAIVNDEKADLHVRAWRWSYNARGIIEMPNHLRAAHTAIIMVHPWGIDDGQGWNTPEPAGVCDFCTPEKNHLVAKHTREIIAPFHASLRGTVAAVLHSLPGNADAIRTKAYRTLDRTPSLEERKAADAQLKARLRAFDYHGEPLPKTLTLDRDRPMASYFQQFPGLDASERFNNAGFWDLPIPLAVDVKAAPDDIVVFDGEGYPKLRDWLMAHQIRHILLTGYATEMCFAKTCAGYVNLSQDFNVFLVGDATLATFPAHITPRFATSAHLAFASLKQLVTQISWVKQEP